MEISKNITRSKFAPHCDSAESMRAALRAGKIGGVIIWRGASYYDGTPVVAVATKFRDDSANDKTGAMIQTFILPDPIAAGIDCNGARPAKIVAWLKSTGAKAICGDCPHAWQRDESTGQYEKGSCYVREYQAPAAVLGGVYRDSYPVAGLDFPAHWLGAIFAGRAVRAGSYGDPAAIPAATWRAVLSRVLFSTGYTHFWKSKNAGARANAAKLKTLVMASCDSPDDLQRAGNSGWRGFLVSDPADFDSALKSAESPRDLLRVGGFEPGAFLCPASKQFEQITQRRTNCAACGACSGNGGKAKNKAHVVIPDHGPKKTRRK